MTASSPAVKSEELKSSPKVPATTLKTPKPESGSPDKTLVKSPPKKEVKITPKKENPLEVDIKKEDEKKGFEIFANCLKTSYRDDLNEEDKDYLDEEN